jgi:hypothetical protein
MTLRSLAKETGIDGHELRLIIKKRISERKKKKLPNKTRSLYSNLYTTDFQTFGSNRKHCSDCDTAPPNVNENCERCVKRERDRISYAERYRIKRLAQGPLPCKANELDRQYTDNCKKRALYEVNGIAVCGFHEAKFKARHKVKCQAHTLTDRFTKCGFNATAMWYSSRSKKEVPVCHRHKSALSGSYGEKQLDEIWRKRKKKQINALDNGNGL